MLTLTPDSLFAHRGLHDESKPKNSLSALVAAADAGYGVELDVHLSKDGVPFVSHDPNTLADTGVDLVIAESHANEIAELRFASSDQPLATLDDVVREISSTVPLLIEIKPTSRGAATVDAVLSRAAGRESTVALQSFQPSIVNQCKRRGGFLAGQLAEAPNARMSAAERILWKTLFTNSWVRPDFLSMYLSVLQSPAAKFWRGTLKAPLLGWTVVDDTDIDTCRASQAGMIFERVLP